jgi:hypothetical protein
MAAIDVVRVRMFEREIEALRTDPPTQAEVLRAGLGLARLASYGAPRDTGAGAESFTAVISQEDPAVADVGWGAEYPYMLFQEVGWQAGATRVPPKAFLERAYEQYAVF